MLALANSPAIASVISAPGYQFPRWAGLQVLTLENLGLVSLPVRVFSNLAPTLRTLSLDRNALTRLPAGLLPTNLTALYLGVANAVCTAGTPCTSLCAFAANAFTTLPPYIFAAMTQLTMLKMQCLPIQTLPVDTFSPILAATVGWSPYTATNPATNQTTCSVSHPGTVWTAARGAVFCGTPAGCGDGIRSSAAETCDDGGTLAGDGCSETW
jgi:hypothetical protein